MGVPSFLFRAAAWRAALGAALAILLLGSILHRPSSAASAESVFDAILREGQEAAKNDVSRALKAFERGLALARKSGNGKYQASFLNQIAFVQLRSGDYVKGRAAANAALLRAGASRDKYEEAFALDMLCFAESLGHGHKEGLELCRRAMRAYAAIGDRDGELSVLNNMASIQAAEGEYHGAIRSYEQQVAFLKKKGGPNLAVSLFNLAATYRQLGAYSRAISISDEAAGKARNGKDLVTLAHALKVSAHAHSMLGHHEKAIQLLKQARQYGERAGTAADFSADLAIAHLKGGQSEAALPLLEESGDGESMAHYYLAAKEFAEAKKALRPIVSKAADAETKTAVAIGLGLAAEGLGRRTEAARHFRQAVKQLESIRDGLPETLRKTFMAGDDGWYKRSEASAGLQRTGSASKDAPSKE